MHRTVWCSGDILKNKLLYFFTSLILLLFSFSPVCASGFPEPGKPYLILSEKNGRAVQVEDAGEENLANIELFRAHGGAGQAWVFRPAGPGWSQNTCSIVSFKSGKVMDVMGYSREDGANVQLFKDYGTRNQRWRLIPEGDENIRIVSVNSGKCLDAEESFGKEKSNIRQSACNAGAYQLWKIKAAPRAEQIFRIISKISGKALDVSGKSRSDGANVELFRSHGRDNQLWTLWHHGYRDGVPTYAIISYHSGKALDVNAKSRNDRANIQQFAYKGEDHQHWRIESAEGEYVRIISVRSGKCLEAEHGSTEDGANIQQFTCNRGEHQLWKLAQIPAPQP